VRQICERSVLEERRRNCRRTSSTQATLVGGGALLLGIAEAMADHLGLPARIGPDPLTAVARGTGVFLEKLDVFSRVLSTDDDD
jgi:actin-like ATPase involved in cell morphogenesis